MNTAIILSGGTGSRLGADIPKQYIRAGDHMMITETILAVSRCRDVDAIRIVCSEEWQQAILKDLASAGYSGIYGISEFSNERSAELHDVSVSSDEKAAKPDDAYESSEEKAVKSGHTGCIFAGFSQPGATRQLSAINGMRDVLKDAMTDSVMDDIVIIHDAARPLVKASTISDIIAACAVHDGAMPVLPMKDTVYISEDGHSVSSLIDRKTVFAGQAPEAFRLGKYLRANEALLPDRIMSINGATEPAILAGLDIAMIPGDEGNFKITTAADLERYKQIMKL